MFKEWVRGFFIDKVPSDDEGIVFYGMTFRNPTDLEVYKRLLECVGRCSKCGDFLFINITDYNRRWGYTCIKECVNHKCDFNEDVSDWFNNYCGIPTNNAWKKVDNGVYKNPPHVYYNTFINGENTYITPSQTGTLESSLSRNMEDVFIRDAFGRKNRNKLGATSCETIDTDIRVEVVNELPFTPKKNACYLWDNGNGFNLYTYTGDKWIVLAHYGNVEL